MLDILYLDDYLAIVDKPAGWLVHRTPLDKGEGLHKTYRAIVRGWPEDAGLIDHALKRMPDDMRSQREEVQAAQTQYRTLRRGEFPLAQADFATTRWAEVELQPLTGRRHQLRRHMKHIAHPIIGDATHGKGPLNRVVAEHIGFNRLWLHALRLELRHPFNDITLKIESPLELEWELWHAPAVAAV